MRDAERIEVFCNQVAAATLMPRELVLAEQVVAARGPGQHEWLARKLQIAELDYIKGSPAAKNTLAENYVGLPL